MRCFFAAAVDFLALFPDGPDNKRMKYILLALILAQTSVFASVVGISSHPLNPEARVLSAEMTGYMSQRNEMGGGLRYTHEIEEGRLMDFSVAGAQDSRGLMMGAGMDFELLKEDIYQPRVSFKPYIQYQKFENTKNNMIGAAPIIRKGFSTQGVEVFPYLSLPTGMKIDGASDEFKFYSSLTLGASMPFPGSGTDKVLLSLEGNKDFGASSDYVGCLVSWVWK